MQSSKVEASSQHKMATQQLKAKIEELQTILHSRENPGDRPDPLALYSSEIVVQKKEPEKDCLPHSFVRVKEDTITSTFQSKVLDKSLRVDANLFTSFVENQMSRSQIAAQESLQKSSRVSTKSRVVVMHSQKSCQTEPMQCQQCLHYKTLHENVTHQLLARIERIKVLDKEIISLKKEVEEKNRDLQHANTQLRYSLQELDELKRRNNQTNPFDTEYRDETLELHISSSLS